MCVCSLNLLRGLTQLFVHRGKDSVCVSVCLCVYPSVLMLNMLDERIRGGSRLEGDQHLLDLLDERIRGDLGDQELRKLCS